MSSGFWALVGRVTALATLLLNYRMICDRLSDSDTSIYVIGVGIASLGSIICGSGLGSVLLRRFSHESKNSDSSEGRVTDRSALLKRVLLIASSTWLVYAVGIHALIHFDPMFFRRPVAHVLTVLVVWVAFRCLLTLLTESLRGLQAFSMAAMTGGQQEGPVVNLLVFVALVSFGSRVDHVSEVLLIHASITGLVACLTLLYVVFLLRDGKRISGEVIATRSILAESGKVLVSQLSIFGVIEIETLLIGRYCDDTSIATWGAIRRLMALVSAPLLLINAAIPRFLAELHHQGDLKRLERLLRGTASLATPPAIVAFLLLYFLGDRVLSLFNQQYAIGWSPLVILTAANIVFVGAGSAGLALRMTDNQGRTTAIAVALCLIYLLIAPSVISAYGIQGAAWLAAGLIIIRNAAATLLVRKILGIWCLASLDPRKVVGVVRSIRRK